MGSTVIAVGMVQGWACVLALGLVTACSSGPGHGDPSWTSVPITQVSQLVGEWEGPIKKNRAMMPSGSVRLMIRENGSYLFVGESFSKVAVGAGMLQPEDGHLVSASDRRAVRLSLYDHKGVSVLLVEATNHETGDRYHGEFKRVP
ncbi:MAG: hypothetical protein P0120_04805 [Nitrospira sp.]|nr:hypothetical protein [Nitrospira sp.]